MGDKAKSIRDGIVAGSPTGVLLAAFGAWCNAQGWSFEVILALALVIGPIVSGVASRAMRVLRVKRPALAWLLGGGDPPPDFR